MRVVLVDPRGDSRPYDEALAGALAARGVAAELWTSRLRHEDLPRPEGVLVRGVFYSLADRLPGRLRRLARGLSHPVDLARCILRLRRERPDVVHVQWLVVGPVDRAAWRVARRLVARPLVYTAHNAGRAGASQPGGDCAAFDLVVVHSQFGRAALERDGVASERIVQVHHSALDQYLRVAPAPPPVPADAPVVAFVGLIRPYKGLDVLLDAWPLVTAHVPSARLLVVGKPLGVGGLGQRLRSAPSVTALLGYASSAAFAGALRRADLVALPYRAIDSSGVLFAALALGTPFVASDIGGLSEVASRTGAGVLVAPGDAAALAEAITHLLLDPDRLRRLGDAARAAAAGPYSAAAAAATLEDAYQRVSSSFAPCSPPRS